MGTNSHIAKLKAQLDQAIIQREHWKQLAENRNSIVVTEVCPESRSVEEYIIDADSVRSAWRLIRGYREKIEALRLQNAMFVTAAANIDREREALHAEAEALRKRACTAEHEAAQALRTLKGLEKVARVVDANSDQVCGENNLLRQEVEALRVALLEIASVNPAERGIEWAKSYASDGLKGAGSELYARWLDTFKEAEALRAEIEELDALRNRQSDLLSQTAIALRGPEPPLTRYSHADIPSRAKTVVAELEAARGLLNSIADNTSDDRARDMAIDFITATPAPEVQAEQGERQEAAAHRLINDLGEVMTDWHDGPPPDNFVDLCGQAMRDVRVELAFSTPQPGPDVRGLAASLYQACGAYDMPDRILDVLSAAANGEPFAHMIDGLLPCVPPSDQDVRGLVEAGNPLSNAAYNLAQKPGHALTELDCELLSKLRKRWDEAVLAHRQAHPQ